MISRRPAGTRVRAASVEIDSVDAARDIRYVRAGNEATVRQIRRQAAAIRANSLEMIGRAGFGFAGSCLSAADILAATVVCWRIAGPGGTPDAGAATDRICLSKGHAAPALYAALLGSRWSEAGAYAALGSPLQGHPRRGQLPGIQATSGSLGLAPAAAIGAHLARRIPGCLSAPDRLLILAGDGELQSGAMLEALSWLGQECCPGVLVVVDHNGLQSCGPVPPGPLRTAAAVFPDHDEVNGHDPAALVRLFNGFTPESPARIVIAHTRRWSGVELPPDAGDAMSYLPDEATRAAMVRRLREQEDDRL